MRRLRVQYGPEAVYAPAMQSLMVDRDLPAVALPSAERHYVTANQRARLSCGCAVYIGRRVDNGDVATVAWPCSNAHRKTIAVRFNDAMKDTLPSESTEPLIDVVARVLQEAAR